MSDVKIRNLEPYVLSKLTEEAKKKKISREEYMRILLTQAALMQSRRQKRKVIYL